MDSFTYIKEDHQFEVNGEVFSWRIVRPEVLEKFERNGSKKGLTWKDIDAQVLQFIPEDEHERWNALRSNEENPVSAGQIGAILQYLLEKQSARPTTAPSA